MANIKSQYYVNDDVTFRGSFRIDGVAQTPDADSLRVTISKVGESSLIVDSVAGVISGTQLQYKFSNMQVGQYALFMTAIYNSGADERTGVIEFTVKKKEAH